MSQTILIKNGQVINRGKIETKDILIKGGFIERIDNQIVSKSAAVVIDATGKHVLPGIIDDQVHFREPGLTHKATILTESRAAVAGGVTSFMEMPNVNPPSVTQALLEEKYQIAARNSLANYSFYMGATNDNLAEVLRTDKHNVCGVKVFMGSSTGNMLVDNAQTLENLFSKCEILIATHCEDERTVRVNTAVAKSQLLTSNQEATANLHPVIRNVEACYLSSSMAVELAKKYNTRLHVLHISTAKEVALFDNTIPLSKKQDNAYFFNLGDVAQSQSGKFQFTATVRCDSTYLGQTHCVEAHIYPDSVCLPLNGWSGASINVTGSCQGDSVAFLIKNVGTAASARGIKNIVVEDNIIFLRGQVDSLSAGGSVIVKVKASGKTFRLTSEQEPNHPDFGFGGGMPTAAVEGCRTTPTLPISLGFVTQYDEDDGNPFVSIDCHQNFGSFDPNDKQTHPQGIDNQHFVNEMAELDYTVRFQNTGTDTAFTVVVRDTLSSFLDVASVRAGASSHNYQFEIVEGKILKFTFPKINLPDSTKNQAASQGFIKFLVKLKPNIPFNTVIKNSAAIFFDFNEPVITNTTFHTLRKPIRYNSKNLPLCNNTPFNGKIYTTDARVYDTLRYPKFDSVTVSILSILPTFKTTVDTSLLRGKNFNGIVIQRDTNIILRYAAKNGCDSIVTVRLRILTATVDLNRIEIKIYPNPFIEKTVIEMPTATPQYSGIWTLNLYDATGRLIATKKTKEQKFELSREDLKTGMYISEILNDKTPVAVGKLMVGR